MRGRLTTKKKSDFKKLNHLKWLHICWIHEWQQTSHYIKPTFIILSLHPLPPSVHHIFVTTESWLQKLVDCKCRCCDWLNPGTFWLAVWAETGQNRQPWNSWQRIFLTGWSMLVKVRWMRTRPAVKWLWLEGDQWATAHPPRPARPPLPRDATPYPTEKAWGSGWSRADWER